MPSIGISEIIKVFKEFNSDAKNDFFVNALGFEQQLEEGDQSIHHLDLSDYSKVVSEDVIQLKEKLEILFT